MADAEDTRREVAPTASKALHFPESEGRFLPENALQSEAIVGLRCELQAHFHGVRYVVVEGNMFICKDPWISAGALRRTS